MHGNEIVNKAYVLIVFALAFLASPAFAVEFKCTGQEKGIDTITGKERVIPITYHITIDNDQATIDGFDNIIFAVTESDDSYLLKASIGKSRLMGEQTIRIDKRTGHFDGKSWLLARENVVTKEGKCESMEVNGQRQNQDHR